MKPALLALLILLTGCATLPQSTSIPKLPNRCLPEAQAMAEGLAKYSIPAEILIIRPADPTAMGHALTAYRYRGKHYAWDSTIGTVELRAPWLPWFLGWAWHNQWADRAGLAGGFGTAFFVSEDPATEDR